VRFPSPPLRGRLLRRYQRFFAEVELARGERVVAHCPNTGSLLGCLAPGSPVWLRDSRNPARKLRFTWQAVCVGSTWVNVDTSLPNRVVAEALARGAVPELAGYARLRREVRYGRGSRIDLLLEDDERGACHVEVKSTTLIEGGAALFPDAVTERGTKHLHELARLARAGKRAVQLFFVSRADVEVFRPADSIDPAYARALRRAAAAGVEVLAYAARVEARRLELLRALPVDLPGARRRGARLHSDPVAHASPYSSAINSATLRAKPAGSLGSTPSARSAWS
jgi:sugar fermentation stimulation protein A